MNVFLSARYSRRDEMKEVRDALHATGYFLVVSRWIDSVWTPDQRSAAYQGDATASMPMLHRADTAVMDLEDVARAQALIAFTDGPNCQKGGGRGGRHVEFGYALALDKKVLVVGPREHVFHYHPKVTHIEPQSMSELGVDLAIKCLLHHMETKA